MMASWVEPIRAAAYAYYMSLLRSHQAAHGDDLYIHIHQITLIVNCLIQYGYIRRSGVGNHYGTFSGPLTAFSAVSTPQLKYEPPGRNFLTNPGKTGSGYG